MTDARLLKAWEEVVSTVEAWAADSSSRTDASCNAFDKVLLDQRIFTIRDGHQVKGTPGSLAMWQKLVLEKQVRECERGWRTAAHAHRAGHAC